MTITSILRFLIIKTALDTVNMYKLTKLNSLYDIRKV